MRGHQEHSLFRSGTNGMGTDRGGREARGLGAFYRLGREYITMQGLLIETRNDLPATFHSTLIPRHFSELTLTARLHENLSLFTDTLFASDIFFSTPLPLFFQLFGIDHTITDGGGHCSILPRCPKVYTNKGTRETVSQPFHPTDSRKSSSKPRRKREAERERD